MSEISFSSKEKRMFSKAFFAAKRRALKKKIPFKISVKDILDAFESQLGRCYYSNLTMNIVKDRYGSLHDPYKMTIDCLIPVDGYVKGNIVWCLYCINSFKQRMSEKEMMVICHNMLVKEKKISIIE
jgi:hypothetical protein